MYVTSRENIKGHMKDKTYKAIMVVYAKNHTCYTYKIYNPETDRVIVSRDIKWAEWKILIWQKP